jgi:peptide subunit release factor 1 (eRF1)
MTNATTSGIHRNPGTSFPSETIAVLAKIHDERAHAVTLYFNRSFFPDKAHREEELSVEHLVEGARNKLQAELIDPGVSQDLLRILEMGPQIRESPSLFRAVFACSDMQIWQEVDLPVRGSISCLEIARHFQLVPLLRALESSTAYCVALVEHGKARIFIVRGIEIDEVKDQFPSVDLSVHADDSRVGWSHHIDANVEERTKAYMKKLAFDLCRFLQDEPCQHLVIGCREDLRSELEPQLAKAGLEPVISGYFHLSSFDMTPHEVLLAATPVFQEKQRQRYADLWEEVRERPAQSAVGVDAVLRGLESGRVHTLFLGEISEKSVTECSNCHSWWVKVCSTCATCGSSNLVTTSAEELLFRKALLTGAEVLAPDTTIAASFGEVGAILRY